MNLILILILLFFDFSSEFDIFTTYGYLKRGEIKRISGNGYCIYIDLSEFIGLHTIYIKITVKNGFFKENNIYFGGYDTPPKFGKEFTLPLCETYDSYDYVNNYGTYYDYYTLHYYLSVNTLFGYYLFSIPSYYGDFVEIEYNPLEFQYL